MDILVIEDDADICRTIRLGWSEPTDRLRFVQSYRQSVGLIHSAEIRFFDCIVIDLHLPDGDGISILRTVRANADIPVVLISGSGTAESRAAALDLGADDYVMKPFSVRELQARVTRLVSSRKQRRIPGKSQVFQLGRIDCNPGRRLLRLGDRAVALTDAEMRIIDYLRDNAGKNCSKSAIYKNAFFRDYAPGDKTLDVYVSRLRKKLAELDAASAACVQTARGFGYKLAQL
jgi:DNA-binding response OmpR family regulator